MLLQEPAPQSNANVVIEAVEDGTGAGTEAIIVAPAAQERIKLPKLVSQRTVDRSPLRRGRRTRMGNAEDDAGWVGSSMPRGGLYRRPR